MMMSIFLSLGGMLLQALFTPKPKDTWGSRISNINPPSVSPGGMIPRVWGTMKLPATMVYGSYLIETMHTHEASKKGGKGMFGNSAKNYTFTYAVDAAWAVCVGPCFSINRIWANQKLLWSSPESQANEQAQFDAAYQAEATRLIDEEFVQLDYAACSAFVFAFNNYVSSEITLNSPSEAVSYITSHPIIDTTLGTLTPDQAGCDVIIGEMYSGLNNQNTYESQINRFDNMDIYLGSDYQTPNALLEGYLGQGNAPSWRNVVYFVITNLQLADFGNSIPQMQVEVQMTKDGTTSLVDILGSVCQQAGLTTDQFDCTSNVDDTKFQGFAISSNTSGREIFMELQKVFPFSTAESGYKVVFSSLNQLPRQVIRREDLGAHADTDPLPASVETTITSDYELPQRINLKYQESSRSYSPNTLYAARYNTPSRQIEDLDVTIALDRNDAQHYVNNLLGNRMLARRQYKLMLPRKYVTLEPTDTFKMPNKYNPNVLDAYFCTQVNVGANGLLEVHASDFAWQDPSIKPVDQTTPDLDVATSGNTALPTTCPTLAYMFDGPLLSDTAPDQPGFYVVLAGIQNEWQGGQLQVDEASQTTAEAYGGSWSSPSSGSQWQAISANSLNVPVGVCMGALSPNVIGSYWDRESVLMVKIYNGMTLQAANEDDMLSQTLNATLIGNEIVAYADVQDMGNGVYKLTNFLRGLKGTERQIGNHASGDRFVRLTSAMQRVLTSKAEMNVQDTFQAISLMADNSGVAPFTFTNTGNSYRPYTPYVYERFRDKDTGDVRISWWPRVRQNGQWLSGSDVQLTANDSPESYQIDVCTDASDQTVVKTYTVTGTLGASWTYTAAMQTADLGAPSSKVYLAVYQMSIAIGRGFGIGVAV